MNHLLAKDDVSAPGRAGAATPWLCVARPTGGWRLAESERFSSDLLTALRGSGLAAMRCPPTTSSSRMTAARTRARLSRL